MAWRPSGPVPGMVWHAVKVGAEPRRGAFPWRPPHAADPIIYIYIYIYIKTKSVTIIIYIYIYRYRKQNQ